MKRITPKLSQVFLHECEEIIGEVVEQEENSCCKVETVREYAYLGDRVKAGGGSESAVTALCVWIKLGKVVRILYVNALQVTGMH